MEYMLMAAIALLVIAVGLLIALLVRQGKLTAAQDQQRARTEEFLLQFGNEMFDELNEQRRENIAALQQTGDRISTSTAHLGQSQTVRGNQDIGGLYIRLFRRDRHNGSLFHRHGDESVPVRGKAGDGRKQAPGHCLSGIVDDGSNFRFQIGVDFCYGHIL